MSWVCRNPISGMVSDVLISSFRRVSEYELLPTKMSLRMPVLPPSLISNTKSTRLFGSSMIFGLTVTSKRPLRR